MINIKSFILEALKSSHAVSDSERQKVKRLLDALVSDVKKSNNQFGQFAESFYNAFKANGFNDHDTPLYVEAADDLEVPNGYPEYYGFSMVLIAPKEGEASLSNLNVDNIAWAAFVEPWTDKKGMDVNVITYYTENWYAEGEAFKLERGDDDIDIRETALSVSRKVENDFDVHGSGKTLAIVFESM